MSPRKESREASEAMTPREQAMRMSEAKRAQEALQAENRRKDEFLAMLAHELRNPLAPIKNAIEILRRSGGSGPTAHEALSMLERQVGHLSCMVNDLLDVSRISRNRIDLAKESTELLAAVRHAIETTRPLRDSMGHRFTLALPAAPIHLYADPVRLAQIVANLVSNACKFSDPGGHVGVAVEREQNQAVIRVKDAGVGIAPEQLHRIFDLFSQVDTSLERSQGGLGIGLTLVKTLVEMHGGTVEAHSEGLGRGSEFVVRFPIATQTEMRIQPEPSAAIGGTMPRRILVVDDSRDAVDSLAMLLRRTGHEVQTATDGLEAVEAAEGFHPDVVLLDIGLPKLNGYEVARRIREQERDKRTMLVAVTGWAQEEDRQRSEEAGFDAHMVKPVDFRELNKLLVETAAE